MSQHDFLNGIRSLFNIDGYQLPELNWGQQLDFVQNPVKFFIQADDEQQAAIWREVAKRQKPEMKYAGIAVDELARSGVLGWHPGDEA
jgi:hypothetical protein